MAPDKSGSQLCDPSHLAYRCQSPPDEDTVHPVVKEHYSLVINLREEAPDCTLEHKEKGQNHVKHPVLFDHFFVIVKVLSLILSIDL